MMDGAGICENYPISGIVRQVFECFDDGRLDKAIIGTLATMQGMQLQRMLLRIRHSALAECLFLFSDRLSIFLNTLDFEYIKDCHMKLGFLLLSVPYMLSYVYLTH